MVDSGANDMFDVGAMVDSCSTVDCCAIGGDGAMVDGGAHDMLDGGAMMDGVALVDRGSIVDGVSSLFTPLWSGLPSASPPPPSVVMTSRHFLGPANDFPTRHHSQRPMVGEYNFP